MRMESVNPTTGELLEAFDYWNDARLETALWEAAAAVPSWQVSGFSERARALRNAAAELRANSARYAQLITHEMGKPVCEARAEIEKCAAGCDYFAEHAPRFLAEEIVDTDAGRSYVTYQPLGTILAVMPWNFPFWQVFRAAAPALMAGNTIVLKHASNVPQCAQAIEAIFHKAGFPLGVFRNLQISAAQAERLVADPRVHAVTLTGSEAAGRRIAAAAGIALKKTVLELGGSDAFIVLPDADLERTVSAAVTARFQNAGQSCIAGKRFILVGRIADDFVARFSEKIGALKVGDPRDEATQIGPLARADLREQVHQQVQGSVKAGATVVRGGAPLPGKGFFYAPTLLDGVRARMRAFDEEVFGPVAALVRARDEADAVQLANDSRFGLGGSVWTADAKKGESIACALECGCAFVNGVVKSDPRLPFGGVKASGYGRELSAAGIREFVNLKTVWIG
jgi:succinate-semialdehyde dehydrogenase / glutarate-semialdehyde dehydrogenase